MSNDEKHSSNIKVVVDGEDNRFRPDSFSGGPAGFRMDASLDSTFLELDYGAYVTETQTLPHTKIKVKANSPSGQEFGHVVAGTLRVVVLGNTYTGTFNDVKVDGTGAGEGSTLVLSGDYVIVRA
ncbi:MULTISPECIES: hypothetical protein [unclassified Pseudomonas]|uniref:hypothetical protein n=1 Tax=unclassified Pseudomonas TaxID=196821 RepID=UPI000F582359|nr:MULTISPECIES: hypothetical protein [unclassified Pseudomonas]AZF50034.1 hypothetical protein C4J86_4847 [Pseudomonas sp. R2-7-07]AZF60540.1 hypothetical protein C4J84_4711 [Pseudomonas sp. R11-23-07]